MPSVQKSRSSNYRAAFPDLPYRPIVSVCFKKIRTGKIDKIDRSLPSRLTLRVATVKPHKHSTRFILTFTDIQNALTLCRCFRRIKWIPIAFRPIPGEQEDGPKRSSTSLRTDLCHGLRWIRRLWNKSLPHYWNSLVVAADEVQNQLHCHPLTASFLL